LVWREKRDEDTEFLGPVTLCAGTSTQLSGFALKIGMSANYEKCVPKDNEELLYWQILNFYREIWRTREKTKSAL
jgi:hypothetical protein